MPEEKQYLVRECTKEELEVFNTEMNEIIKKHLIKPFAIPTISEVKIIANIVAMKLVEK